MKILELLHSGSRALKLNRIETHQLDSELVLSSLLKKQRENLITNSDQKVSENIVFNFEKLIARRANNEPLAYILKYKEFWSFLETAILNIASSKLGLNDRVKFFNKPLENIHDYKFDLVVSNPPYIRSSDIKNLSEDVKRFEPKIALDGGKDGLDVIKKVIYKSKTILKRLGWLALEIGYGQHYKVSQILKKENFKEELLVQDYKNNVRCVLARFKN